MAGPHGNQITQWKSQLWEGAAGGYLAGSKANQAAIRHVTLCIYR